MNRTGKLTVVFGVPVSEIAAKETILRIHLPPLLGTKRVDAITNESVQLLKSSLRDKFGAKLANEGIHVLRYTFCSHLAMQGAPARAIQELAGHKDLSTTQPYMHLSPAATFNAIRLLDRRADGVQHGDIVETGTASK